MRNRQAWALSMWENRVWWWIRLKGKGSSRMTEAPICAAGSAELHLCVRDHWKVEQKSWAKVALNWTKLDGFQGIAWGRAVGSEIRGVIGEGRWYRSPGKDFTFWWDAVRMGCYQYGRVLSRGIAWSDLGFWKVFSIWRKDSRRTRLTSGRSGGWQLTVIQVEGGGGDDLLQGSSWDGGEKWTWTDF